MCTGIYSSSYGVILDSGGVTRYVYSCMHVLTCLYMFVCAAAISVTSRFHRIFVVLCKRSELALTQ